MAVDMKNHMFKHDSLTNVKKLMRCLITYFGSEQNMFTAIKRLAAVHVVIVQIRSTV